MSSFNHKLMNKGQDYSIWRITWARSQQTYSSFRETFNFSSHYIHKMSYLTGSGSSMLVRHPT